MRSAVLTSLLATTAAATATPGTAAADCKTAPLLNPSVCCAFTAPPTFTVTFNTSTGGSFDILTQRAWSPYGADRFYSLAKCRYFDSATAGAGNDAGFFRVVPGFVVQFGIAGLPPVSAAWENLVRG
jgi:peptidyl-prolyl cis-trans isomerase A (cyclophilin A)